MFPHPELNYYTITERLVATGSFVLDFYAFVVWQQQLFESFVSSVPYRRNRNQRDNIRRSTRAED